MNCDSVRSAVFRVNVFVPALCRDCGTAIPDDRKEVCAVAAGIYLCPSCLLKAETSGRRPSGRSCARCGRDVAGEAGADRPGEFVCAACRKNPDPLAQSVPAPADGEKGERPAIEGYTVLRKLGQGGMGAVYLAREERTGRQVAVKVMLPQVAADARAVKRFLEEMAHTRSLVHRNVVGLWDAGYSRSTFYLTLEYCDGDSVAGLRKLRGGTLPLDEAVEITLQALEGLHHGHTALLGRVLVHRDVKPPNLCLTGSGSGRVAKVGDYGLVRAFDDAGLSGSTRTGDVAGTPSYMPRQQVIHF